MTKSIFFLACSLVLLACAASADAPVEPDVVTQTVAGMEIGAVEDVAVESPARTEPAVTALKVQCAVGELRRLAVTKKSILDVAHECDLTMAQVKRVERARQSRVAAARAVEVVREK